MATETDLHQSEVEHPDAGFEARGVEWASAAPPRFGRLALCMAAAGALAIGVLGTVAYGVWFNHDQQAYADAISDARRALGMPAAALPTSVAVATVGVSGVSGLSASAGTGSKGVAPTGVPPATSEAARTLAIAESPGAPAATAAQSRMPDGEQGSLQAVWSGQVTGAPAAATAQAQAVPTHLADATSATTSITPAAPATSPSPRPTRRATSYTDSAAQPSSAGRPAKDAQPVLQDRRISPANAKHPRGLFARMGLFFRRVSYRQHGSGRQQPDLYSHS